MVTPAQRRWRFYTAGDLARAIFTVVAGNIGLLDEDYLQKTSVWGKAVKYLRGGVNELVDRYWLWMAFVKNSMGVQEKITTLCDVEKVQFHPAKNPMSLSMLLSSNEAQKSWCFCQKVEGVLRPDEAYTKCNRYRFTCVKYYPDCPCHCRCKLWLHNICIGVEDGEYDETKKEYVCQMCKGEKVEDVVPKIFLEQFLCRPTYVNSTLLSDVRSVGPITSTPKRRLKLSSNTAPDVSAIPGSPAHSFGSSSGSTALIAGPTARLKGGILDDPSSGEESDDSDHSHYTQRKRSGKKRESDEESDIWDGPIKLFDTVNLNLPWKQWVIMKPVFHAGKRKKDEEWRCPQSKWANTLREAWRASCPTEMAGCTIIAMKHRVNTTDTAHYFNAYAKCKRKDCGAKYYFYIEKKPKDDTTSDTSNKQRTVPVGVQCSGTLLHNMSKVSCNQLRGSARDAMKKKVKKTKGIIVRNKLFDDVELHRAALDKGNHTSIQTPAVLRKCRSEVLLEQLKDRNPILDLVTRKDLMMTDEKEYPHLIRNLRSDEKLKIPGFIQQIQASPLIVVMYRQKQFEILKRLVRSERIDHVVFSFDASGGVVKIHQGKEVLQFDIAISLNAPDGACIPVMSFLSVAQDTATIEYCIKCFLYQFRKFSGIQLPYFGVRQINTDHGKAVISGTLMSFGFGSTKDYLQHVWRKLDNNRQVGFVHHLCYFHVKKYFEKRLWKEYGKGSPPCRIMMSWLEVFVRSVDLYGFCRHVREVLILTGFREQTDEVDEVVSNLSKRTERDLNEKPWRQFVDIEEIEANEPFFMQSPWGRYSARLCESLKIPLTAEEHKKKNSAAENNTRKDSNRNDGKTYEARRNNYYRPTMVEYLIHQFLPYAGLMDHSLLRSAGLPYSHDTTAVSESNFKLLKFLSTSRMKLNLPMTMGPYIRKYEIIVRRRLERFDIGLTQHLRTKRNMQLRNMEPHLSPNDVNSDKRNSGSNSGSSNVKRSRRLGRSVSSSSDEYVPLLQPSPPKHREANVTHFVNQSNVAKKSTAGLLRAVINTARKRTSGKTHMLPDLSKWTKQHNPMPRNVANDKSGSFPEHAVETWSKPGHAERKDREPPFNGLTFIPWGNTSVTYNNKTVPLTNTCPFDNVLELLYVAFQTNEPVRTFFKVEAERDRTGTMPHLVAMLEAIHTANIEEARRILCELILQKPIDEIRLEEGAKNGDLWGSEAYAVDIISPYLPVVQHMKCGNQNCPLPTSEIVTPASLLIGSLQTFLEEFKHSGVELPCPAGVCLKKKYSSLVSYTWTDQGPPPMFLIHFGSLLDSVESRGREKDIPRRINLLGSWYTLQGYSLLNAAGKHFYAILFEEGKPYLYDGLTPTRVIRYKAKNLDLISTIVFVIDLNKDMDFSGPIGSNKNLAAPRASLPKSGGPTVQSSREREQRLDALRQELSSAACSSTSFYDGTTVSWLDETMKGKSQLSKMEEYKQLIDGSDDSSNASDFLEEEHLELGGLEIPRYNLLTAKRQYDSLDLTSSIYQVFFRALWRLSETDLRNIYDKIKGDILAMFDPSKIKSPKHFTTTRHKMWYTASSIDALRRLEISFPFQTAQYRQIDNFLKHDLRSQSGGGLGYEGILQMKFNLFPDSLIAVYANHFDLTLELAEKEMRTIPIPKDPFELSKM